MKARMLVLLAAVLMSVGAFAQSTHSVDLSWTASVDAVAPNVWSYTVYRTNQLCSALPLNINPIASGVTTTSYVDNSVLIGYYCYTVTATVNGAESVDSNLAEARILPLAPTNLKATAK